jgi:hypothetical protein
VSIETGLTLRAIVAEAVIRQDEAAGLLLDIRARRPLAELAPRGGVLVSRFVALRHALPPPSDATIREVGEILDHHAMLVSSALDLLAVDWRSERMVERLAQLGDLGEPARRLDTIWTTLAPRGSDPLRFPGS